MACQHDHSNTDNIIHSLPINQGGVGRHKCAACAYEAGLNLGRNRTLVFNIENIIANLDYSQRGPHRHVDPVEAFALGYYHGISGN